LLGGRAPITQDACGLCRNGCNLIRHAHAATPRPPTSRLPLPHRGERAGVRGGPKARIWLRHLRPLWHAR
jgi:hypothetical protein